VSDPPARIAASVALAAASATRHAASTALGAAVPLAKAEPGDSPPRTMAPRGPDSPASPSLVMSLAQAIRSYVAPGMHLHLASTPSRSNAAIRELARAAGARPVGLHVHHGAVAATSDERFAATARDAWAAAADAGVTPRFVNLGGAWHAVTDLASALPRIRAALPVPVELIIEPGRRVADAAGFACGRVAAARALDDRELRILDLSRCCHLRWSQPELVAPPPRTAAGRRVLFVGPTCYEDDVLGEWTTEPDRYPAAGRVVLRHITGYAVAWNTGFAGIAPADVLLVE